METKIGHSRQGWLSRLSWVRGGKDSEGIVGSLSIGCDFGVW